MNKKLIFTYLLLSILLLGSTVVLAYQVRYYLKERQDPLAGIRNNVTSDDDQINELNSQRELDRKKSMYIFETGKSFEALATPVPYPTPTPPPPPTPIPIIPAKNYKIVYTMGQIAVLRDYQNKEHHVKVGDVVQEKVFGNFKILEVIPDMMAPKVKVQHIESGTVRIIDEMVQSGKK